MRVTRSRTARLLAAAGALSAAFAVINAPIAVAQPDLACSGGEVAFDGSCVPPEDMNNANVALGLPRGTVNDVVPSLNQGGYVDQGGGFARRWLVASVAVVASAAAVGSMDAKPVGGAAMHYAEALQR